MKELRWKIQKEQRKLRWTAYHFVREDLVQITQQELQKDSRQWQEVARL